MGFRFQKRISLLPGLRINLSKSGISTSVGTRGAWLNFSPKGIMSTLGLPGSGLSYRKKLVSRHQSYHEASSWSSFMMAIILIWAGAWCAYELINWWGG